jgi:hypothetical protein
MPARCRQDAGAPLLTPKNKNATRLTSRRRSLLLLGCLLHQAQYFLTLQPILHVGRARLLSFLVSADLSFLQGSSALSDDFNQSLTVYAYNYTAGIRVREVPQNDLPSATIWISERAQTSTA